MSKPDSDDKWVHGLLDAGCYDHPVQRLELIETHISWVILTGQFAYKIKKPVDLGFLDFSTLDKRHACALAELHLNRRLAPELYLEVVPITGSRQRPSISRQTGREVVDWAVKMLQFPQAAQLDRMLEQKTLDAAHLDAFAVLIADFHQNAPVAEPASEFGSADAVYRPVAENFRHIRESALPEAMFAQLDELERWNRGTWQQLLPAFEVRKQQGFIRECHGDLHLRNLAWINDAPVAFDCIEFNADLRWIDVLSDVAFLVMDLRDRGEDELARRFLNAYLERTGDYEHLGVLPFYLCYRALVRAKVTAIRLGQAGLEPAARAVVEREFSEYLDLAGSFEVPQPPCLILTCGLSGSGKTTVTAALLEQLDAIRLRSDVERKRLFGMRAEDSGQAGAGEGIYDTNASDRTYERLLGLAEKILAAGMSVIVDAASLEAARRVSFRDLAQRLGAGFVILEISAPVMLLRQRLRQRSGDASDADVSILEAQLEHWPVLRDSERDVTITVDTTAAIDAAALVKSIDVVRRFALAPVG